MSGKIGSIPNAVSTLLRKTAEHTDSTEHKAASNAHEVGGDAASAERTKGFGQNLNGGPTLKTIQTSNYADDTTTTAAPATGAPVSGVKEKARAALASASKEVGSTSFDAKGALLSREIDQKLVDQRGIDAGYKVLSVHAEGQGSASIGKKTAVEGSIRAGATLAELQVAAKTKYVEGTATATLAASGSAHGSVKFDISKRPTVAVTAGGEAFVGAKVSAQGRLGTGDAAVTGKVEGMAGIGVKANVDVGLQKGRFKAKVELGACLGIGGSASFGVDVNYEGAVNKAKEVASGAIDGAKQMVTNNAAFKAVTGFAFGR